MLKFFILVACCCLFVLSKNSVDASCEQFKNTQHCLDGPDTTRASCITKLHKQFLHCVYKNYGEGVAVVPPKPLVAPSTLCDVGKVFLPNACKCAEKQICTARLCYCYKSFEGCLKTKAFGRRSVCVCGSGKKRNCSGGNCTCEDAPVSKTSLVKKDTWKDLPRCSYSETYVKGVCMCNRFERCTKGQCKCHSILPPCPPSPQSFGRNILCNCKVRGSVRTCKGDSCTCKKVKACNLYKSYSSKSSCYCKKDFKFMGCQKVSAAVPGKFKSDCRCTRLSEQCAMDSWVKRGTCFCSPKTHTFRCQKQENGTFCKCEKKPFCQIDTPVNRPTCRCQIKPTTDLEDENSEKHRVHRKYGWKSCQPSDPKNPKSSMVCICRPLKCYEAGRFKKYFCKCPRLTKQYCNKKTGYCKCLWKKPSSKRYKGYYKFRGMIATKSLTLASFKYDKRIITVWTKEKKSGLEKRWIFVDHHNGSFYVVQKPTIASDVELRAEMSLYDDADQNSKNIQKQIQKKQKKVLY